MKIRLFLMGCLLLSGPVILRGASTLPCGLNMPIEQQCKLTWTDSGIEAASLSTRYWMDDYMLALEVHTTPLRTGTRLVIRAGDEGALRDAYISIISNEQLGSSVNIGVDGHLVLSVIGDRVFLYDGDRTVDLIAIDQRIAVLEAKCNNP